MANSLITPDIIAGGMLEVMHNACPMISRVNRGYEQDFGEGAQVNGNLPGPAVRIRKPVRATVTHSAALDVQPTFEEYIILPQTTRLQISRSFSTQEMSQTVASFNERYITPDSRRLASEAEKEITALYSDVYNVVGTDSTNINRTAILAGRSLLSNYAVPFEDRFSVLTPDHDGKLVDSNASLFNPSTQISKQNIEGQMGNMWGFDHYMDQNLYAHTTGTRDTTCAVSGASQSGATLLVTTVNGYTFNKGDTFTIAGCFLVNYETKARTTTLQPFVVTADTTATGATVTLPISPSIVTSGATQTVWSATSNMPASGATITFHHAPTAAGTTGGTYAESMLVQKNAFALAVLPLYMPSGVDWKARADGDGLSIRAMRVYVPNSDLLAVRMDMLLGTKTLYEFAACRVLSA
jgi:hypothetical protein